MPTIGQRLHTWNGAPQNRVGCSLDDEKHGGSLVPILALAHEHDPDPAMRSYEQPISAEKGKS